MRPGEAIALLERIIQLPGHEFWPDDLCLTTALFTQPIAGHRQVMDAYLVALAAEHGGVVATLDRGVAALARGTPGIVEVIFGQ